MKNAEFRMQNVKKQQLAGRYGDRVFCGATMPTATSFNRKERKDRKARTGLFFKQIFLFAFFAFFAVLLTFSWPATCSAEEAGQPFVRLYDIGTLSPERLLVEAVAAKSGWVRVPADDMTHKFKGDVAFGNERLVVVLRANGIEVYSAPGSGKWCPDLDLIPMVKSSGDSAVLASAFRIGPLPSSGTIGNSRETADRVTVFRVVENTSGAVAVEVTFTGPITATFRVAVGQPYVEMRPGAGIVKLLVGAVPRRIVVPDFFGDDMVFTPDGHELGSFRLPAENFVLGLNGTGESMTMCVWQDRTADAQAMAAKMGSRILPFAGWKIDCIEGKSIWVAFLEGKGLWQERAVPGTEAGKVLDWKPPFPAKWRADLVRDNGFAESLTFESPPTLAPGKYIIYPLDRTRATPLTEFTPVDILRNTLGVGPCQYILETEGLASADNPTPDNVITWVEKQVKKKGGKAAADEIRERLKAMAELAGRTEARIKRYADFAAEIKQLLASDNSEDGPKHKATVDALAKAAADGLAATQPQGRVAKLADAVAGLIGKDTAAADLAAPAAELRSIGAAQDRALAKSRMAVRWLGCQAPPPYFSSAEEELVKRTEVFLQGK
jgi:hypothetical protein